MKTIKESINFFMATSSTKTKVLFGLCLLVLVVNFIFAAATGTWFLNPFVWKGTLAIRAGYAAIAAAAGLTSALGFLSWEEDKVN